MTASFRLARIFQDRMVLQRDTPLTIWGTAAPGRPVQITIDTQTAQSVTEPDGRWRIELAALPASRGLTMHARSDGDTIALHDVAVGEVWIAGGQSNMEFQLEFDAERDRVFSGPMSPDLRFFDQPQLSYHGQEADHDYSLFGIWRPCTVEDLRYVSAVGYYFAAALHAALDIPIGIVGCNWGGTPACAWADPAELTAGTGRIWIEEYQRALTGFDTAEESAMFRAHPVADRSHPFDDSALYRLMREVLTDELLTELLPELSKNIYLTVGTSHPNRPGGLFDCMVTEIAPYSARGVIWYQGESDEPHAEAYDDTLTAVIRSWRTAWNEDLPFLITQLAPFGGNTWGNGDRFPAIREQQARVAATEHQVWMASTADVGNTTDIHPKQKRPVGERLALLALGHIYGSNILCDAPVATAAILSPTGVRIQFDHGEGLSTSGSLPLEVLAPNGKAVPTDPRISVIDAELRISGPIPEGTRINFARTGYYEVGLKNAAGLPALPFTLTAQPDTEGSAPTKQ